MLYCFVRAKCKLEGDTLHVLEATEKLIFVDISHAVVSYLQSNAVVSDRAIHHIVIVHKRRDKGFVAMKDQYFLS